MRGLVRTAVLGLIFGLFVPVPARADTFINPWGGVVFGNDQARSGFRAFGVTIGDAGHGLVGTETTVGFAPGILGSGVENYLLDVMAGVTIGKTFRAKTDHDTRPYAIVEGGTVRTKISGIGTGTDFARNNIGLALGGGMTVALTDSVQFRGDLRYIRAFEHDAANSLSINLEDFHYWRTEFGVVFH
jgi:opacity protein-like surface antigen